MALTYKQNYLIYLVTLAFAVFSFLGVFDFITQFKLESFSLLSVQNAIGIGLFYLAYQIYRNQVDYY